MNTISLYIARYHERLYRLALLTTGDSGAAVNAVLAAFRGLKPEAADPEADLVAALLSARPVRWRFRPATAALARAGLTATSAAALLRALARATPADRHSLGYELLLGMPLAPSSEGIEQAEGNALLSRSALRVDLAIALGELSADADRVLAAQVAQFMGGALDPAQALLLRGALLADPTARALRDGLARTEASLRQALPALFAVVPPPSLLERLEQPTPRAKLARRPRFQLVTAGVVLALVAALLGLPELWRIARPPADATSTVAPVIDAQALVERALTRMEAPLAAEGLTHERYVAELGTQRWQVERWLEAQPPYRLDLRVTADNDQLLYAVGNDSSGRVQYRVQREGELRSYDYTLSAEQLAAMLPILRQQPDSWGFLRGSPSSYGLDRFYLAQARNSAPISLGTRSIIGRVAQLIAYRTVAPFPNLPDGPQRAAPPTSTPAQVILAIDPQSLALLEVTVTPEGEGQREAARPWRAELIEQVAQAQAGLFALPSADTQQPSGPLISPRLLDITDSEAISLSELLPSLTQPIYLPSYLPEPTSGVLLRNNDSSGGLTMLREGPQSLLGMFINTGQRGQATPPPEAGPPEQVGDYFYYPIALDNNEDLAGVSFAAVAFADPNAIVAQIYLAHQYLSREEREQQLRAIVAGLRPLTTETARGLGQGLYRN